MLLNESISNQIEAYAGLSDTFKLVMHLNGSLSLFTSAVGIYMILFRSTKQMGIYKFYLLNIAIWSALFDIFIGFFYAPQLMFPAFGICTDGLLQNFRSVSSQVIMSQLTMWLAGGLAVSIAYALLYRFAAITNIIYLLHKKKSIFIMVCLHIFYIAPPMLFDMYAMLHNYDAVMDDLKTRFPATYHYSLMHACVFFSTKVTPLASMIFPALVAGQIAVFVMVNLFLIYVILQKLNKDRCNMSRKTFAMHRQLTVSLAIQFTLSNLFIAVPFSLITILMLINKLDTPLARISGLILFVLGSLHSTLNSVTMICLTRPYRQALVDIYYCLTCRRRARSLSIVAFDNSSEIADRVRKRSIMIAKGRMSIPNLK